MPGRMNVPPPTFPDQLSQMVESNRANTGQEYQAVLLFGLWGTSDCSPEVRIYAGYQHLRSYPEDSPSWIHLALVLVEDEQYEQAEYIIRELLRTDAEGLFPQVYSESPEALLAYIHAEAGSYEEALRDLEALEKLHGLHPLFLYTRATIHHQRGNHEQAVTDYDAALVELAEEEEVETARKLITCCRKAAVAAEPWDGVRIMSLDDL